MPAIEVEIKAHVTDADLVIQRLVSLGFERQRSYDKHDQYFSLGDKPKIDLRIRNDGQKHYITFKDKKISGGVEENKEFESELSDAGVLVELLTRIGFQKRIEKHKRGFAFKKNQVLAEVSLVERLGWFIELEVVIDDHKDPNLVKEARDLILDLLDQLEIPASSIEARPYTKMLADLKD